MYMYGYTHTHMRKSAVLVNDGEIYIQCAVSMRAQVRFLFTTSTSFINLLRFFLSITHP